MYKKGDARARLLFCLLNYCFVFSTFSLPSASLDLKVPKVPISWPTSDPHDDLRVLSNDPRNNCETHFGSSSRLISYNRDLKSGRRPRWKRRWKSEFAFFQSLSRLLQVTLSNVGEPSQSWIPQNHIQVQKERGNFVVACVLPLYIVKLGISPS